MLPSVQNTINKVNAQYLPNANFREGLRTSNLVQRWSTKTCINNKRNDIQCQRSRSQGHVTQGQMLAHKSRMKRSRNTKIARKVAHQFKVKGPRSRSLRRLMLRPKVHHIFRTERPTERWLGGLLVERRTSVS